MWGDKDESRRLSWEETALQGHSTLERLQCEPNKDPIWTRPQHPQ